jgi:signal transduction histidine kinase
MAAAPDAGNALVMRNFLYGLLTWCPLLLVVSSVGGYWLSRRALEPVDSITAAARSISIGHLGDRVPVPDSGDELQRLAETCNAMLDRLQASVTQIKRFTADASHELRGPLSFARTVAEVCLRSPGTDPGSRTAFADIVQEMSTAAVLLEDMLTLARADALPASVEKKPVDLAIVLREACALAEPIASQRGLLLRLELPADPAPVLGDATFLRRMIWTLLDNAIKYSRDGGSIRVRLSLVDGEPKIDVRDDGIGILPEHLPFIFDRFYRADPSRAAVEGSGLGLAIAKWTAEAHGAILRAVSTPGVETLFTVDWSHSVARQAESYRRPT